MLKADEEGQMLILRKYFCYIFSNANGWRNRVFADKNF